MSRTLEEVNQRLEGAVNELVDEMDKKYLRKIKRDMFSCSARCCEDKQGDILKVSNCIESCNTNMKRAHMNLEQELATLQDQFSRCTMSVYDKSIQTYGPDPSSYKENKMAKFRDGLDKGVVKCVDEHIQLLPKIKERFINFLTKNKL